MGAKKTISAVTLDQVVLSATSFAINILLIRHLSVESFGVYVITFSFLFLASSVHTSLITAPIGVIVSKLDEQDACLYIRKLNFGQISLSVIIALTFLIVASGIGVFEEYRLYQSSLYGAAITAIFYLGQLYLRSILLSRLRVLDVLKNDSVYSAMQIINVFVLIFTGYLSVVTAIISIGISASVAYFYGLFQCRDFIKPLKVNLWEGVRENVTHGRWLLGTSLIAWARTNALNFITLYFIGPVAPAVIRAVQTIFGPAGLVLVSLESMVPQFCSKIYALSGVEKLSSILSQIGFVILSGMLVYVFFVGLFAEEILGVLFGENYVKYEMIVWIMCVQHIFIVWQTINLIALRVLDAPNLIFKSFIIESFLTIIPGILIVDLYGLEGAMIWKLVSSIVVSLITYFFYKIIIRNLKLL